MLQVEIDFLSLIFKYRTLAINHFGHYLNPNFWMSGYYLRAVVNGARTVIKEKIVYGNTMLEN